MVFKGFTVDNKGIYIHLDNIILQFESVDEMEKIAEDIKGSASEIKGEC